MTLVPLILKMVPSEQPMALGRLKPWEGVETVKEARQKWNAGLFSVLLEELQDRTY